jgi:tetratricopeptide (TPR) repeat protein
MRKIIVSVFLVLIFICSCSGKSETALDWFNKALALNYTNPTKNIEYLSKAIKLKPDYADAYNERGIAYSQFGQYQRALADFNEAIRLKPDNVNAHNNMGIAYFNMGQYQRAIESFNEAIRIKPDSVNSYKDRGIAYFAQGNKKLGCSDAHQVCALGRNCKLLEAAKNKGLCN